MAFKPCTGCGQRFPEKATSVYAAWMEDSQRKTWTARLCYDCIYERVRTYVIRAFSRNGEMTCDSCGASGPDNYNPIYLTIYRPQSEMEQIELVICEDCIDQVRIRFQQMGQLAVDRPLGGSRGPVINPGVDRPPPW